MRLVVFYSLQNRDETTTKDARILNGFAESDGEVSRAIKRPGLASSYTVTTGVGATSTYGQALFSVNGPSAPGIAGTSLLFAVRGDVITRGI